MELGGMLKQVGFQVERMPSLVTRNIMGFSRGVLAHGYVRGHGHVRKLAGNKRQSWSQEHDYREQPWWS